MRGNSYKKFKKEPQLKIGSKKENLLYSEKNINPELNFLNKQLSQEEYNSIMRKKNQKEEFSALSKNFQDNYMGLPNLAHQRIDFDNVAGKIGQERREMDINKYQQQPSFAKDQVYNTYINNDKERNNKKYFHNIINNTIFGFCDPSMKYPKTSYQSNYQGNEMNEHLKQLSKMQYDDYLRFRKEQIEMMNKGNLGQNLRELPPRKKRIEQRNEDMHTIQNAKELREKQYKEKLDSLIKEQRLLDQNQARTLNQSGYIPSPEEYELYLQQQKMNAIKTLESNNIDNFTGKEKEIPNNNIKDNNIPTYMPNNPKINENYYNINKKNENYHEEQPKIRYTPKEIENKYNNQQKSLPPKNEIYGNEVPQTYEDYQRLLEREKYEKEKIIQAQQKYLGQMPEKENEYNLAQMEALKQEMINKQLYDEEKMKEIQRREAEEEYLKNVKKYEDIIQDNPEQKFKLPPPPFEINNIPNKMNLDNQLQGSSKGFIDKNNIAYQNSYDINNYSLGETDLKQNPIVHPVNSYQFDYSRLYNPLINKNK